MPSFIDLLQRKLTRITDPAVQAMVATGLVGALTALFTAYLNGRLAATREQFIDYCVEMLLSRQRPRTREHCLGTHGLAGVSCARRCELECHRGTQIY